MNLESSTPNSEPSTPNAIFTVGHSNHPFEVFLEILEAHGVARVLDVRRFPASRRWPHFAAQSLSGKLRQNGIDYVEMPQLGGRRKPRPDSRHTAWRVESFRGYADFMDTPDFEEALGRLMALALEKPSALMCAEALPWRCHRSLIADALLARGWRVFEILSRGEKRSRRLPDFARLDGTRLVYDGPQASLPL